MSAETAAAVAAQAENESTTSTESCKDIYTHTHTQVHRHAHSDCELILNVCKAECLDQFHVRRPWRIATDFRQSVNNSNLDS